MKIEICGICEGTGVVEECGEGSHNKTKDIKCRKCDGSGRLITGTYRYEVPFTSDKSEIYAADGRIIRIIRTLQTGRDE